MYELKCKLCLNYMRPQVPQCIYGHNNTCMECFHLNQKCSFCFGPPATGRNRSLEYLLQFMDFGKDEWNNCRDIIGGLKEAIQYEKVVFHAHSTCPMWFTTSCKWRGSDQEIVQHFRNDHKEVSIGTKFYFYLKKFNEICFKQYISLYFAHHRLFKMIMCFDDLEMMVFGCNVFGDALEDGSYIYVVSILILNSHFLTAKFAGNCGHVVNGKLLHVHPYILQTDCSNWKQFCDRDGNLYITLQIINNQHS